jgi:hypothetical protein
MVGDGQRIAVPAVTELELALEVGAPQIIGGCPFGQRRATRAVARPAAALDQAVTTENRMDGAFGWNSDVPIEPPDQQFADLASPPVRLLGLETDDQALDLNRQLISILPPNLMNRAHVPAVFDTGTVIRRSMRRLRTGCSTSDNDNMPNDGAETLPLTKRRACTFDWRNISHLSENFHV